MPAQGQTLHQQVGMGLRLAGARGQNKTKKKHPEKKGPAPEIYIAVLSKGPAPEMYIAVLSPCLSQPLFFHKSYPTQAPSMLFPQNVSGTSTAVVAVEKRANTTPIQTVCGVRGRNNEIEK